MATDSTTAKSKVVRYLLWAGFISLLATPIVLLALWGNRADKKQIAELRRLAAETPLYPKFVQTKSTEFDKLNYASLTITYNVPAYTVSFDDVKLFYTRELTTKGWQPQATRDIPLIDLGGDRAGHVTFRTGEHTITVEPDAHGTEYYVTYKWGSL